MRSSVLSLALLAALGALSACAKGSEDNFDSSAAGQSAAAIATPPAAVVIVTDPQIAAIVVAANNVDIAAGRNAAAKSTNAQVKAFAQRMITDHNGVNKAASDLVKKLGVTPEESPVSKAQTDGGTAAMSSLAGLSGAAFDKAYIANEVKYHQDLLAAIDTVLMPSVQNAELKTLLTNTRPAVEAHLKAAQDLQGTLGT